MTALELLPKVRKLDVLLWEPWIFAVFTDPLPHDMNNKRRVSQVQTMTQCLPQNKHHGHLVFLPTHI